MEDFSYLVYFMHMKTKIIWSIVFLVIVVGGAIWASNIERKPGELDQFAQCLNDSGAKFYGAFWCPHCAAQKKLFGNSVTKLPYVECSNPDGKTQTQICKDKEIKGYPTWIFADGSQVSGEQTLATLSEKTQCELPAGEQAETPVDTTTSEVTPIN